MSGHWVYDDGGRAEAGFKGQAGDCVTRALAIASERPYREVYDRLNKVAQAMPRRGKKRSTARTGVSKNVTRAFLRDRGWTWHPTMGIGTGCRVHLRADELPAGRLVVQVSGHLCAVVDGVIHDTYDPSRDGTRCVYGYWTHDLDA